MTEIKPLLFMWSLVICSLELLRTHKKNKYGLIMVFALQDRRGMKPFKMHNELQYC